MAEARSEEDEENMRDPRDQVVRRHPGGRPDRQKPEHRHSQGPLSSIRAAIKRTSRPAPVSDSSRERNRRRPEITILSAEPLASTSWFPGASGGFPPPPPPPAQIWGPSIPPASIQLPPSYEEVIREKTQEVLFPPSSSACSSTSSRPASTTTIATQTDAGSTPNPRDSQERRPVRPRRPRLHLPSHAVDITTNSSPFTSLHSDSPLTLTSAAQTDHQDHFDTAASSHGLLERPRPRPRSKLNVQPVSSEVKVQTLVRLHDDCLTTLASSPHQDVIQGKYLQELLEAFRTDDWGFPDCRGDSSGHSQSESEEGDQEEEEDMATLRARMQAFEKQVADESCGDTKRPEPRPRPRLQGQPAKSAPPTIAPKPKIILPGHKPSTSLFWEENNSTTETLQPATESAPVPVPKPCEDTTTQSGLPLPAPRPPPLNVSPVSKTKSAKPPARPPVAPRASAGVPPQDSSTATGHEIPTLPPRRSVEISRAETQDTAKQSVKTRNRRPDVPAKPLALNTPRRASAPDLLPKPPEASPSSPDQNPVPPTPSGLAHGLKSLASAPAPAYRRGPLIQTISETGSSADSTDPPQPPRPSSVKLLPPRSPSVKSIPERPPPPSINTSANQTTPPPSRTSLAPAVLSASQAPPSPQSPASTVSAIQVQSQKASKKGPPLPPRPKPGHPLYNSYMVQRPEILIILDDQSPSEDQSGEGISQTVVTQPINQSQCLLDIQSEPAQHEDSKSKMASENLSKSESPSILPMSPSDHKDLSEAPPISGPRCIALSDYEGEEDNELTFSQGDVITLLELTGPEWGRGQIYGRMGIFPLKFTEVVEPLPQSPEPLPQPLPQSPEPLPQPGPSPNTTGSTGSKMSQDSESEAAEWVVALFDFPGQTDEDLSFRKGALIQVTEHIDAEWRRGRLEGREGLYPTAFTQGCQGEPIPGRLSAVRGVAKFDFTAESEDELTLKVGDIITQVETVDEQWILGVVGGKHGIAPKNFISLF